MTEYALPLRAGTAEDWDAISRLLFGLFHETSNAELVDLERSVGEPERSLVVTDGDQVVGHAVALTRDLTVPGGIVPAAHVTGVGVAPTHRRRRLLTRMMHQQLREVYDEHREPIAVLWASEARIYPRFGYGLAGPRLDLTIDTHEVGLRRVVSAEGRLRAAEPLALIPELSKVYEQLRPERPGWSGRDERWWTYLLADPEARRRGGTELRAAVHETASGVDGYALWRTKSEWSGGRPNGEVWVVEVAATNLAAHLALWEFLLGIDLTRSAHYGYAAPDEPLLYTVDNPRALHPELRDGLWLRVVDLPAALSARRYAAAVDVVLEVADPLLPENTGRWRLAGDGATASCTRTDDPADLAGTVTDLGAAYLGGPSLAALAAAGRVRELRAGAVAEASAAFGWHRAPVGIELF